MDRAGKRLVILAVLIVAASLAGEAPAHAGTDGGALLAEAMPHLRAVLKGGRPSPLAVRIATPAEVAAVRDEELEAQLRWQLADLRGEARQRAEDAIRGVFAATVVARYDVGSDTFLILPDNARALARWDETLAAADSPAFLQLALVYEFLAALNRQGNQDSPYATCRDTEEFRARQARDEGETQLLTRRVARRLGTEACFPLLARRYQRVPDTLPDPGLRAVSQQALAWKHAACVQGLAFFDYLEKQGIREVEDLAAVHAPRQMEWIRRPELYLRAQQTNRPDLADTLTGLEASLSPRDWTAAQQAWTPAMVCEAAALLGEKARAERVVRGWDEARSLIWTGKRGQVAVGIVRLRTTAAAQAYYAFATELQRKQDQLGGSACAEGRKTLAARFEPVRLARTDEALRCDRQFQFGLEQRPVTVTQLWVRGGERVLEFTWQGTPPDLAWAEKVAATLLGD